MVRLPRALVEAMDAGLEPGEKRSELIRASIESELARRKAERSS